MRLNTARTTVAFIALAMAVVIIVPTAYAQNCSLARAAGNYAASDSGTVIGVGPRAAVASLSFDAKGNVVGSVTASLNGTVTQSSLSGTYTVNPDCSGTASFGEFDQNGNSILTATVNLAWDDNMREARFIFTSIVLANGTPLAAAVNGEARKTGS